MASTYLQRTGISAGNRRTWTFSAWIKRTGLGEQRIFNHEQSSGTSQISVLKFDSNDNLLFADNTGSGNSINLNASLRKFRDINAWYHIVLRVNTTDATENDRVRIYLNGLDMRTNPDGHGYSSYTQPSQDYDTFANQSGNKITVGAWVNSTTQYFNGIMSHVHFCDGYSYAPTEFGETDATTGEWKIKTSPSVSYGTNGFFWLKDSIATTDHSPNSNTFTVGGGTLTKTEDCPSDVFCTFNSLLHDSTGDGRLTNGNTTISCVDTTWISRFGTIGFTSGKYYWELKVEALNASNGYAGAGIQCLDNAFGSGLGSGGNTGTQFTSNTASAGFEIDYRGGSNNNNMSGGSNLGDTGIDYSNGDVLGFAVDMDNRALYMHKNGTYITVGGNVGVPTSGASKTGAITIPASVTTCSPAAAIYGANAIFNYNFGNGYFKTTAVSSAGTNASGIGIFEYDVPTGYTALSTKGLNE